MLKLEAAILQKQTKNYLSTSILGFAMLLASNLSLSDLPHASYTCKISGTLNDQPAKECPDSSVPGQVGSTSFPITGFRWPPIITLKARTSDGSQSSRSGPSTFVSGAVKSGVSGNGVASFSYSLQLNPIESFISDLTGMSFPVKVSAKSSASSGVSGPTDAGAIGYGLTSLSILWPRGGIDTGTYSCAVSDQSLCIIEGFEDEIEIEMSIDLHAGETVQVGAEAQFDLFGTSTVEAPATVWAHASVDPNFWIDPDFTFMLEGKNYRAADVLELTFSPGVEYSGKPADPFLINAGLNDAWVNSDAPFQGLFVTVFPDRQLIFLAWFTFDVKQSPEDLAAAFGAPDQRWVTALGSYEGNEAELKAELTTGGKFSESEPLSSQDTDYGTINIEFSNCEDGAVSYTFPLAGLVGSFNIKRALDSNVALCEALNSE